MIFRPDTCRCVIAQEHDPAIPGSVVNTGVLSTCEAHAGLDEAGVLRAVSVLAGPTSEQGRKTGFLRWLLTQPTVLVAQDQYVELPNGRLGVRRVQVLHPDLYLHYTFAGTGADRILDITMAGIPIPPDLQQAIDTFLDTPAVKGRIRIHAPVRLPDL